MEERFTAERVFLTRLIDMHDREHREKIQSYVAAASRLYRRGTLVLNIVAQRLRFCPERRLYLDRDREAARTIARLCRTEMLGLPRPAVFSKSFKLD